MEESHYRKYYLSDHSGRAIAADLTKNLRPMKEMTEEEAIEVARLIASPTTFDNVRVERFGNDLVVRWGHEGHYCNATGELFFTPAQFHYLCQQKFDLFGINK